MNRTKEWGTPALALGMFLLTLGIIGRMEMEAMPNDACTIISEEPTGPEPDVTIWHATVECGNETEIVEFYVDCGIIMEPTGIVAGACQTETEIAERIDRISNVDWGNE
jgi:hypothetical protein